MVPSCEKIELMFAGLVHNLYILTSCPPQQLYWKIIAIIAYLETTFLSDQKNSGSRPLLSGAWPVVLI